MADIYFYLKSVDLLLNNGQKCQIRMSSAINVFKGLAQGQKLSSFYAGITNDPDRREDEHNANFIGLVLCQSEKDAKELEKMLDEAGFDTGARPANGGNKDTKYVYLYKKSYTTKE
ncbi:MAG: hypothetical protein KBT27_15065 [Prevotellaceae bacterium]|nr:hypothetical protein [Candidatus Faecinaster equi]